MMKGANGLVLIRGAPYGSIILMSMQIRCEYADVFYILWSFSSWKLAAENLLCVSVYWCNNISFNIIWCSLGTCKKQAYTDAVFTLLSTFYFWPKRNEQMLPLWCMPSCVKQLLFFCLVGCTESNAGSCFCINVCTRSVSV